MRFARFFIDRPIFAAVLSLVITLAGALALLRLPISEYPSVVPPTVVVRGVYPGANPKVIAETVASPLEQQMNGVEDMLYMFSQATADGRMTLTVTFALGTDLDTAQVQVQNRVAQALPRLPQEVQRIGLTTEKASPDIMMAAHLVSPDERYDMLYLSNLAHLRVKDELARIPGVGDVQVFGAGEYSMRVWLDPDKLAARELTATDVVRGHPRAERPGGRRRARRAAGARPTPTFQLLINAQGRLTTEDEFRDIVVRATPTGQITRVRDVGRVELGVDQYALRSLLDNKPAVTIGISQRPGSNALQASSDVRALLARAEADVPGRGGLQDHLRPHGLRPRFDSRGRDRRCSRRSRWSSSSCWSSCRRGARRSSRWWPCRCRWSARSPSCSCSGFSLNTLSLFGLVLAIGIVVDDAIVVVENVERHIEHGLAPREATYKAMEEVSGPIIAIALVLCAVFIPTAFVSGLTGQFYRQFALTIAISTVISAFNSLTLSPALASRLLRPHGAPPDVVQRPTDRVFGGFFRWFNRVFSRGSIGYVFGVDAPAARQRGGDPVYGGLLATDGGGLRARRRSGFVPPQDKQYLVAIAQLPDAASLDRTEGVIRRMSDIALKHPGVEGVIAFPGLSVNGFVNASNAGTAFVILKSINDRHGAALSANAIVGDLNAGFGGIQEAFVAVFPPPPVQGIGSIGGFKLYVEDRGGNGFEELDPPDAGRHRRGLPQPGAGRPALELPGERAADRHARRPRARQDLRRGRDRRVRDLAGVSGLGWPVRERLQPVRPHLPGERAGRAGLPPATRADRQAEDPERPRRDGAPGLAGVGVAGLRARPGDALQRVPGGRDQRRPGARRQFGPGAGRPWRNSLRELRGR